MLHSCLTYEELERWVTASPADLLAKVEVIRRGRMVLAKQDDYVNELEAQAEAQNTFNHELRSQVRHLQEQLLQFEQV